jgi:hypothetical protein
MSETIRADIADSDTAPATDAVEARPCARDSDGPRHSIDSENEPPATADASCRIRARHLTWDGLTLRLKRNQVPLATLEPDAEWPALYRIRLAGDDRPSDMVNLTRAKDAAVVLALKAINQSADTEEAA